jgi:hypothetical protein
MIKKFLISVLLCGIVMLASQSCRKSYAPDSAVNEGSDDSPGIEEAEDYIWIESEIINITLAGNSITADNSGVTVTGSKATITSAGTYEITGTLNDGQIIVDSDDAGIVRLILNGVNITCSNSAPVLINRAGKALIVLGDNTQNTLTDGASYILDSDNEPDAALFSKSYLSFYGTGTLTVNANYKDGIAGKDGVLVKSGKLNITSADDGIRGKDYFIAHKGNITINSKGDGIKSDNDIDTDLGYITIDSALLNITSGADGLAAKTNLTIRDGSFNITTGGGAGTVTFTTGGSMGGPGGGGSGGYNGTVSEKAMKAGNVLLIEKGNFVISSADDAIHSDATATINDGIFSIASGDDAVHAETSFTLNEGTMNVSKSYEGIESAAITINKGTINLVAADDAFNATKGLAAGGTESNDGSLISITGGYVCVNATTGDGLDSNGNVTISGGTVVVHGPSSSPEVGFDINGTFAISGGFIIGTGPNSGNMIEGPTASSSQYSVKTTISSTLTPATLFHMQDESGTELVTFKPVRNTYYIVFSSPQLVSGNTYSIYTGGSSTGINTNGLYNSGIYSDGVLKKSFTISSILTNVSF